MARWPNFSQKRGNIYMLHFGDFKDGAAGIEGIEYHTSWFAMRQCGTDIC
jgi:hypothetical protein